MSDPMAGAAEEMKKALMGAGSAPVEVANDKPEDPENPTDPASGGDTPPEDADKEPDPVPYGRFKEKLDEANTFKTRAEAAEAENKELMQNLADLAKSVGSGNAPTKTEKIEAKEDIETLVRSGEMSREDADRFLRVLNAAGVKRGEDSESGLKKELEDTRKMVKTLEQAVYGDKDKKDRSVTLQKFEGIVTEDQLVTRLKEMLKSGDPDRIYMANNSSYEKIIKAEFADDIVKFEVAKVLDAKKPGAPKISKAPSPGNSPKKPEVEEVMFNADKPGAFDADLRASVKQQLHKDAE